MSGTVAVVVTSFQRPRMLAACLASIEDADAIVVADDGSSFDVARVMNAAYFNSPERAGLHLIQAKPVTPEQRMTEARVGNLINRAVSEVDDCDYLAAVLCDDDLMAPGWLQAARQALDTNPRIHMVLGKWGLFNDGDPPDPLKLATFNFEFPATAGNFVYRTKCATDEGCIWSEASLAVHDCQFLANYARVHGGGKKRPWLGQLDVLAGYRRDHGKTISRHSLFGGDRYLPDAMEMFAVGAGGME